MGGDQFLVRGNDRPPRRQGAHHHSVCRIKPAQHFDYGVSLPRKRPAQSQDRVGDEKLGRNAGGLVPSRVSNQNGHDLESLGLGGEILVHPPPYGAEAEQRDLEPLGFARWNEARRVGADHGSGTLTQRADFDALTLGARAFDGLRLHELTAHPQRLIVMGRLVALRPRPRLRRIGFIQSVDVFDQHAVCTELLRQIGRGQIRSAASQERDPVVLGEPIKTGQYDHRRLPEELLQTTHTDRHEFRIQTVAACR